MRETLADGARRLVRSKDALARRSDGGSNSLKLVGVFVDLGTARSRKIVITLDGEKAGPAAGTRLSRRNGGC